MQQVNETLFQRDTKGNPRMWEVAVDGNEIHVTHGLVSGKKTTKVTKSKPMNVGRSNATTAEEQALKEAIAKHVFQIEREDYNANIDRAGLQFRPQLALDYRKVPHRVNWGANTVVMPKLDGLRLSSGQRYAVDSPWVPDGYNHHFEMMTRKGETYHIPHLMEQCIELQAVASDIAGETVRVLDGEAYYHGWKLQKITSAAKKYRAELTDKLEYHLFDLGLPENFGFDQRHDILSEAVERSGVNTDFFKIVPYYNCNDELMLETFRGQFCERGFEGAMIRHRSAPYSMSTRDDGLFKYKKFFDIEALIIAVWEDDNGNGMWTVRLPNGIEFNCTPKRTHEVRKKMLTEPHRWINQWVTVQYQDLTDDGVPTFGVGKDLRECNSDGEPLV